MKPKTLMNESFSASSFKDHLVYEDGKRKKLYCFLMITLIRFHQNAFRYFEGYPEEMLYDNMKQVSSNGS